jgi:hypothetical protein
MHPSELKQMPLVMKRVKKVQEMRTNSVDAGANELAKYPTTFRDKRNPPTYILIPSATSESRKYIPIGFFSKNDIAHNSCHMIANGNLYTFGMIHSEIYDLGTFVGD